MLKRKSAPVEVDDDDMNYTGVEDDEEDVKPRRGKKAKPQKQRAPREPKQKKPSGFLVGDAYDPYQGKINAIMYFVTSIFCVPCILMLLCGGKYLKRAKAYMEETGDTEGIGYLAAGKAIRSAVVAMLFIGIFIGILILLVTAGGVLALGTL